MALINKIREKSGLAVGIIAVGLILFLLGGDLLGPNSVILGGGNRNEVGEIAGTTINIQDYQREVEKIKFNYQQAYGRTPSEAEMNTIREQAWTTLINSIAFEEQYKKLGVSVTTAEQVDMVQGSNIHPFVLQFLQIPEGQEVDPQQIKSMLSQIRQMGPEVQLQWANFENQLVDARKREKYDNLFLKTNYVTRAEGRREYRAQTGVAEGKYLFVPFYTVSDSLVEPARDELEAYLDSHEDEFKTEAKRAVQYVSFSLLPDARDSSYYREEMAELIERWKSSPNDSLFALNNSDAERPVQILNMGQLPEALQNQAGTLADGQYIGPVLDAQGRLTTYKILAETQDSVRSARASHILVRASTEEEKEEARQKASDLLQQALAGEDFAALARNNSDDGSASRGGDLGWFSTGRMVEPFENAVFSASSIGVIPRIIETQYGFHIINVTEVPSDKAYKVGLISRDLIASDETRNEAFREADNFAASVGNLEEFLELAENDSLTVERASDILKNSLRVGRLSGARELVRWTYNEAGLNDVSPVFEIDDQYIVAVLVSKTEEGTADLDDVYAQVATRVKNEKKAAKIIEKLKGQSGTLDEIAAAYGDDARVYNSSEIKMNTNSLPSVGYAPIAVGKLFGLEEGQRTEPFQGESGVLMVELEALTMPEDILDFTIFSDQIAQQQQNRISFSIAEAVEEFADITDKRYKFY